MQVLIMVDRSGSVVNNGAATVQKYKDQVTKVWHTLHNISVTYGGFSSGYLLAFASRTADQTTGLLAKDNDKNGSINEADRNLNNLNVLSSYDAMTQNIYFSNSGNPEYPSTQTASYGYNPKSENRNYLPSVTATNWHESLLTAEQTVGTANATGSTTRPYSMVLMVTDGAPTVDDGPNNTWDIFKKKTTIDENFDGSESTTSHVSRARDVINSLRTGNDIVTPTKTFTPVPVYGLLIGGGTAGASRMSSTFGAGNWFQSTDFDTTLGAQLLSIVGKDCPPAGGIVAGLSAKAITPPTGGLEETDLTYTVDLTNTGGALLDNVSVTGGIVVPVLTDTNYSNEGLLAPGKIRRFKVIHHINSGDVGATVVIPYAGHVAEDASMMLAGSPMNLSGTVNLPIAIQRIARPV